MTGSRAGLLLAAALTFGCGGTSTPIQREASAIELSARSVSVVAQAVEAAAYEDARATCPEREDACLDGVSAEWATEDAAIRALELALDAWLAAAESDPQAGLAAFLRAYADVAPILARRGISIPLGFGGQ